MTEYQDWTVVRLKEELKSQGLSQSGKKADLIQRLLNRGEKGESESPSDFDQWRAQGNIPKTRIVLDDSPIEKGEWIGSGERPDKRAREEWDAMSWQAKLGIYAGEYVIHAILMAFLMIIGTTTYNFIFVEDIPDYELIDFDQDRARGYAQTLVDLGHPEWGGRMSGTVEEANGAEAIKQNLTEAGMGATVQTFSVPMFEIIAEPTMSICAPGPAPIIGTVDPCGIADIGAEITSFTHREDFVIQGYSGTMQLGYAQDAEIIDLGNGSEDADWASASGAVGMVWGQGGVSSNTELFLKAQENDLFALILVNMQQNCDELVAGDCVPYFKTVDVSQFETMPAQIAFVMVSKSVGETIREEVMNGTQRFQIDVRVDNEGNRDVTVPCGVIPGATDDMIIFGAHHDTVYNGPGAVDDTSGTATVIELAQQFGALYDTLGEPEYTLKFCAWGGEEEGLFGSSAWVEAHQEELREHLRLYVNFDMSHVDAERNDGLVLFGNSEEDVQHIANIHHKFKQEYETLGTKYPASVRLLDSEEMPYNSDHAPFVFEIDPSGNEYGRALVCYGSGSLEYHTYLDTMDRFNEESLAVSGIIYGSYARWLAWG